MNEEDTLKILMFIAVLAAYVKPNSTTKRFNKLRSQIRKGLKHTSDKNEVRYTRLAKEVDAARENVKEEIRKRKLRMSIVVALESSYAVIDKSPHRNLWFSEKTFSDAILSIAAMESKELRNDLEIMTHELCTLLQEALGLSDPKGLLAIKRKVEIINGIRVE